jgi:hypothetical protein
MPQYQQIGNNMDYTENRNYDNQLIYCCYNYGDVMQETYYEYDGLNVVKTIIYRKQMVNDEFVTDYEEESWISYRDNKAYKIENKITQFGKTTYTEVWL